MRIYYDKRKEDKPEDMEMLCQMFCNNDNIDLCNVYELGKLVLTQPSVIDKLILSDNVCPNVSVSLA